MAVDWAQALRELAGRLGMASLQPDEDGTFTLLIGDQPPMFLQIGEESDEVLLFAPLGSLPPEQAAQGSTALLQANHFWVETGGFTLSMVPSTLNVMLVARRPIQQPDAAEALFDLVDRFAGAAAVWRARVADLAAGRPLVAAET